MPIQDKNAQQRIQGIFFKVIQTLRKPTANCRSHFMRGSSQTRMPFLTASVLSLPPCLDKQEKQNTNQNKGNSSNRNIKLGRKEQSLHNLGTISFHVLHNSSVETIHKSCIHLGHFITTKRNLAPTTSHSHLSQLLPLPSLSQAILTYFLYIQMGLFWTFH